MSVSLVMSAVLAYRARTCLLRCRLRPDRTLPRPAPRVIFIYGFSFKLIAYRAVVCRFDTDSDTYNFT